MTCSTINSQSPVYDNEDIKIDREDFAAGATEPLSTITGMLSETHLPSFIHPFNKHQNLNPLHNTHN